MSSVLVQVGYFTLSYAGILLFCYFAINFFLKGFLWHWLRVRPSKGKKVLIFAQSTTDLYVTHGTLEEDGLFYKARNGATQRFPKLAQGDTYPAFAVWCVDIDEPKKRIINKQNLSEGEIDPNDTDRMLSKAVDLPKIAGLKANIVTVLVGFIAFVVIILGFMLYYTLDKVNTIIGLLNQAGVV